MMEGPSPYVAPRIPLQESNLETIPEVSEAGSEIPMPRPSLEDLETEAIIPLQGHNSKELWEEIRNLKKEDASLDGSAPFSVIHLKCSLCSERVPMSVETHPFYRHRNSFRT